MSAPPRVSAKNVILIGPRGCGKSSVGRAVAERLGWTFVDTDARVEARAGRSIRAIFAAEGEAHFRELEARIIEEVSQGAGQVIAVGGGAVLRASNRDALRRAGTCVWLTAPAEELHRRLQSDARSASTRPALTDLPALDEVRHLLAEREPLYAGLAEHVVATTARTTDDVAAAVLSRIAADSAGTNVT